MKSGIKIVTQGARPSRWRNERIYNHRVGMAELRAIKRITGKRPIAVGSEEGQMVVHFPPLLFFRKGARRAVHQP